MRRLLTFATALVARVLGAGHPCFVRLTRGTLPNRLAG